MEDDGGGSNGDVGCLGDLAASVLPATVDSTEDADEAEDQVVDVEHIVLDLLKGFAQVEVH